MIIVYIKSECIQMAIICSLQSFKGLIYFFCINSLFNTTDKSLTITTNAGVQLRMLVGESYHSKESSNFK